MNELEDEPLDVQLATPVDDEVRRGQCDPIKQQRADGSAKHTCKRERPIEPKADCCEMKRARRKTPKTVKMFVFGPECDLYEHKERVYPQCLTKSEYIDFLATPKEFCPTQCAKVEVIRRIRPMPPRIEELARPTKRRLIGTMETFGSTLTAEKLDHLIQYIEGGTALTPEQAENIVRDQAYARKLSKKKKKKKLKCPAEAPAPRKPAPKAPCEAVIDVEAANCQYSIAQCFVRSILCRSCAHPRDEYSDIAEVILRRLSEVLQYEPVPGTEDRKSQQMRLLANVFACWITEILVELADKNREQLEAECQKREEEAKEAASMAAELSAAADADEDGRDDDNDDDDDDDDSDDDAALLSGETSQTEAGEEEAFGPLEEWKEEAATQCDADDAACQATEVADDGQQCDPEDLECQPPDLLDDEQQTEHASKFDAECSTECDEDYDSMCKLATRVSASWDTDVPFVTFAKIFDTLYCMIECASENALRDPLDNRIHRAIYEKFESAIISENPELFTPKIKDVVDVIAGKLALWVRRTLDCDKINWLQENPPEVESKEVRCWSKWVLEVADWGVDQSRWLNNTIDELRQLRCGGKITRGGWQDYTSKFDKNAMLFRRAYKEAQHEQHHKAMMYTDREVVKSGCRKLYPSRPVDSEVVHASGVHEL